MSFPRAERGQTTVEYTGLLVLVALLLVSLIAFVPAIGGIAKHAVDCLVPGGDCKAAGTTPPGPSAADAPGPETPNGSMPAAFPTPNPQPGPAPTPPGQPAGQPTPAPQPSAVPAPEPAPAAAVPGYTGQAANLPHGGSRPYIPPKNSHGKPKKVKGDRGIGYEDADKNVWVWDPKGHGGPHWDVEHKDGSHTNVYPDGEIHQGADNFPNKSRGGDDKGSQDSGDNDHNTAKAVGILGGIAAAGGAAWWIGKLASPACGPFVVVCAVVL